MDGQSPGALACLETFSLRAVRRLAGLRCSQVHLMERTSLKLTHDSDQDGSRSGSPWSQAGRVPVGHVQQMSCFSSDWARHQSTLVTSAAALPQSSVPLVANHIAESVLDPMPGVTCSVPLKSSCSLRACES